MLMASAYVDADETFAEAWARAESAQISEMLAPAEVSALIVVESGSTSERVATAEPFAFMLDDCAQRSISPAPTPAAACMVDESFTARVRFAETAAWAEGSDEAAQASERFAFVEPVATMPELHPSTRAPAEPWAWITAETAPMFGMSDQGPAVYESPTACPRGAYCSTTVDPKTTTVVALYVTPETIGVGLWA
jgi:hypothetical protein